MGKFGKRNVVSKTLTDYNIAVLGVAGIGKTTLMVNVCHKLVGDDGYIVLNMGKEDGISCINGAIYENVENWKKFDAVLTDIIKNKESDYPDLKIIVIDTIDQLFEIAEPEVIRRYNQEKLGERNFKPANSINAAYGGYGAGLDKTVQLVLDKIWDLKRVNIAVWMCGHTKNKDIVDPLTDQTYTTISANLSQKYFNAIKTKMHIVGMAVIDRDIVTEATGRKDINKNDITKNKIVSEARKIIFRDDNYGVDSKSRFADIVEEIPLDADAFIKAVQDAIYKAENKPVNEEEEPIIKSAPKKTEKVVQKTEMSETTPKAETVAEIKQPETEDDGDFLSELNENEIPLEELRSQAKARIKEVKNDELKANIKKIVASYGKLASVDREGLNKILDLCS